MIAITTRYLGQTNYKTSRVRAESANGQTLTLNWDNALNGDGNHRAAARALIEKYGWGKHAWFSGGMKDNSTVWVCCGFAVDALCFTDSQQRWAETSPRESGIREAHP